MVGFRQGRSVDLSLTSLVMADWNLASLALHQPIDPFLKRHYGLTQTSLIISKLEQVSKEHFHIRQWRSFRCTATEYDRITTKMVNAYKADSRVVEVCK